MEHLVKFERGYDCIRFKCIHGSHRCIPGAGGSHGVHGLNLRFLAKGNAGTVQFLLFTSWLPKFAVDKTFVWGSHEKAWPPFPADLGFHSKTPQYEGHTPSDLECEYCDGQPCYYDGSGLNANLAMYTLVNGGEEALWKFMDEYYLSVFEGGTFPTPVEYSKELQ